MIIYHFHKLRCFFFLHISEQKVGLQIALCSYTNTADEWNKHIIKRYCVTLCNIF